MNEFVDKPVLMIEVYRGERGVGVSQISKVVDTVKQ